MTGATQSDARCLRQQSLQRVEPVPQKRGGLAAAEQEHARLELTQALDLGAGFADQQRVVVHGRNQLAHRDVARLGFFGVVADGEAEQLGEQSPRHEAQEHWVAGAEQQGQKRRAELARRDLGVEALEPERIVAPGDRIRRLVGSDMRQAWHDARRLERDDGAGAEAEDPLATGLFDEGLHVLAIAGNAVTCAP